MSTWQSYYGLTERQPLDCASLHSLNDHMAHGTTAQTKMQPCPTDCTTAQFREVYRDSQNPEQVKIMVTVRVRMVRVRVRFSLG